MKFTVIISCAHGSKLLSRTLNALASQDTRDAHDTLVIDDGKCPGREQAVIDSRESGLQIRYLHLQGISMVAARNLAARESSGDILAFVDDDGIPPRGWLSALGDAFHDGSIGAVGGPDRIPTDAPIFEQGLDYVLTSFLGTLGMRSGGNRFTGYYPRFWNMAIRRDAVIESGGFDENTPEAPELPMMRKLESMGYGTAYRSDALVHHLRETDFRRFVARDFRLSKERGEGSMLLGLDTAYGSVTAVLLFLAAMAVTSRSKATRVPVATYSAALVLSGIHAAVETRSPVMSFLVPSLMLAHHAAHVAGYVCGKLQRIRGRR